MKIDIRQYAPNQGVSVHVSDKKVTINEVTENGAKQIYCSGKNKWQKFAKVFILNRKMRRAIVIASIIIIAGITTVLISKRDTLENRLYKKNYEQIADNNTNLFVENSAFNEAKRKYKEGESNIAWLLLKDINQPVSFETEKIFYQGLVLMEMDRHEEAIIKFIDVLSRPDSKEVLAVTKWYLGLCYLKTGERNKSKETFKYLNNLNVDKSSKARHILRKLENNN